MHAANEIDDIIAGRHAALVDVVVGAGITFIQLDGHKVERWNDCAGGELCRGVLKQQKTNKPRKGTL